MYIIHRPSQLRVRPPTLLQLPLQQTNDMVDHHPVLPKGPDTSTAHNAQALRLHPPVTHTLHERERCGAV